MVCEFFSLRSTLAADAAGTAVLKTVEKNPACAGVGAISTKHHKRHFVKKSLIETEFFLEETSDEIMIQTAHIVKQFLSFLQKRIVEFYRYYMT